MVENARNQEGLLPELRSRLGGKLSKRTAYDGNVCSTRTSPAEPWILIPIEGNPFTHELRTTYRNRRIIVSTNQMDCRIEVRGELATRILTVNREEKIAGFKSISAGKRKIGIREYLLYTETGETSLTQELLVNNSALARLLDRMILEPVESVHFSNSGITTYLRNASVTRCINTIERSIDLLDEIEVSPEDLAFETLPGEFHSLISHIKKWGLSDDGVREELLENSTAETLRELVDVVEPYIPKINSYVDSFPNGTPDEAGAALGRLAECATEAKQMLLSSGRGKRF